MKNLIPAVKKLGHSSGGILYQIHISKDADQQLENFTIKNLWIFHSASEKVTQPKTLMANLSTITIYRFVVGLLECSIQLTLLTVSLTRFKRLVDMHKQVFHERLVLSHLLNKSWYSHANEKALKNDCLRVPKYPENFAWQLIIIFQ